MNKYLKWLLLIVILISTKFLFIHVYTINQESAMTIPPTVYQSPICKGKLIIVKQESADGGPITFLCIGILNNNTE